MVKGLLYCAITLNLSQAIAVEDEAQKNGEYIFNLGGCASCHTIEGRAPLAGGLEMETRFGTFFTPNISPDKPTGIGEWSDEEFLVAMTSGVSPSGEHYYPTFPYTSYSKMTREDLLSLKRYLDSQPAVSQKNIPHDLSFPFNSRSILFFWKLFNFDGGPFISESSKSKSWNRGAYIINGPGHCVECHTARNILGGLKHEMFLEGNPDGPEGESVPGLTPGKDNRINQWSEEDILFSLQLGMIPDGDFLGGSMGQVIENTTSKLTEEDLRAITNYLKSLSRK